MRYRKRFYEQRHRRTLAAARRVLGTLQSLIPRPDSVVDAGCGVGTWLRAAQELGARRIAGYDGPWVPREYLQIDSVDFHAVDFGELRPPDDRFDLAISLEVAEHLPPERAPAFVDFLATASDLVLFGAAIPGQGGVGHVNEQWPDYWGRLFQERDYACLDLIRPRIWAERDIPWWYRQNTLVFLRRGDRRWTDALARIEAACPEPLPLVHPELFESTPRRRIGKLISQLPPLRG